MGKLKIEKHERFCEEWIKDLNSTQAYFRAYKTTKSEKAARSNASKLIAKANVQERIKELMAKREKRTNVTQDMVVERLADLAFGHLGLICSWDNNGLVLLDSKDLTAAEMAIISSVKVIPVSVEIEGEYTVSGKQKYRTEYRREVSQKDSLKALEILCRHLGMLDGVSNTKTKDRVGASERVAAAVDGIRKRLKKRGSKS